MHALVKSEESTAHQKGLLQEQFEHTKKGRNCTGMKCYEDAQRTGALLL